MLDLYSVIPEAIVHPLTDELEGRLRSIGVFPGHVEVIDEADNLLLTVLRSVFVLGSPLKVSLDDALSALGCCSGREIDSEVVDMRVEGQKDTIHEYRLTDSGMSHEEDLRSVIEE